MNTLYPVIPKTLEDCYKEDSIAKELKRWSDKIESLGSTACVILAVIGGIISVMGSFQRENWETDLEFSLSAFLASILIWGIYVGIEYIAYKVLGIILMAYARMVQNSSVSSRIALYQAAQANGNTVQNAPKTPEAQSINKTPVSTAKNSNTPVQQWECRSCGTKNPTTTIYCRDCGEVR